MRFEKAPFRRLLGVEVGAGGEHDLGLIAGRLDGLGVAAERTDGSLHAVDPTTHVRFAVSVVERLAQAGSEGVVDDRPGAT